MNAPLHQTERTTSDLRFCREQFESIRSDVADIARGRSAAQLAWQPEAAAWSIAACIEHLNRTTLADLRRISALTALARAAALIMGPYDRQSLAPIVRLDDPSRPGLSSTAVETPPAVADPLAIVARFDVLNGATLEHIDRAAAAAAVIGGHPHSSLLLDMVSHSLQLSALHHWRFILQARRVMERPGFPRQ